MHSSFAASRVHGPRAAVRRVVVPLVRAAVGAALLVAASKARAPLLAGAVPLCLQPQAVLLLAARLPLAESLGALGLWLSLAARGWPVLASGTGAATLVGPAFGYVLSYALVVPLVAHVGRGRGAKAYFGWLAGGALTLLGGWAGLTALTGSGALGWQLGVAPFYWADAAKVTLVFAAHAALPASRPR